MIYGRVAGPEKKGTTLSAFAKLLSEAEDTLSGRARLINSREGSDGKPEASEDKHKIAK